EFYLSTIDVNNHFEDNIMRIEKFKADKVWSAMLYDASQKNCPYLKRFLMEATAKKQNYLGDNPKNKLIVLSDKAYPRFEVHFTGGDSLREPLLIDVEEFIAVKGFKAKGKRVTLFAIDNVVELEPTRFPEGEEPQPEVDESNNDEEDEPEANIGPVELSLF
ncbi:MAG: DNA gyrase/topoisomerase IV subunit A, partial [Prevotellaceae bacterium]|nr:DNA gyrase/topoisomerase IV subunit A [Prevotellaceae bacterium]